MLGFSILVFLWVTWKSSGRSFILLKFFYLLGVHLEIVFVFLWQFKGLMVTLYRLILE